MTKPIRMQELSYPRGADVRLLLRFRAKDDFDRVVADLSGPSGHRVRLLGETERLSDVGGPFTSVVLEGQVPADAAAGHYKWTSVQGKSPTRDWTPLFETLPVKVHVVEGAVVSPVDATLLDITPL